MLFVLFVICYLVICGVICYILFGNIGNMLCYLLMLFGNMLRYLLFSSL